MDPTDLGIILATTCLDDPAANEELLALYPRDVLESAGMLARPGPIRKKRPQKARAGVARRASDGPVEGLEAQAKALAMGRSGVTVVITEGGKVAWMRWFPSKTRAILGMWRGAGHGHGEVHFYNTP